ncbi:MAG: hypothetical protein COA42_03435 [Alteromonadaceae bacterium]|nr:MAG: hypothetical protein COA42_03435 [Alteromonadaceae bacterium]
MRLRPLIFLALAFILTCAGTTNLANAANDELYKIVDKDGNITFSDTSPKNGAEVVQLKTTNVQQGYKSNESTRFKQQPKSDAQKKGKKAKTDYQIQITAPHEGQKIGPVQKSIDIQVSSANPLLPEHRIQFLLNGQAIGSPSPALNIQVPLSIKMRGKKSVTAILLDAQGQRVSHSQTVNFYIIRPGGN